MIFLTLNPELHNFPYHISKFVPTGWWLMCNWPCSWTCLEFLSFSWWCSTTTWLPTTLDKALSNAIFLVFRWVGYFSAMESQMIVWNLCLFEIPIIHFFFNELNQNDDLQSFWFYALVWVNMFVGFIGMMVICLF